MARRAWIAIGSTLCGVVLVGGFAAPASASTSTLVNESFTGATTSSPNWTLPTASSSGTNDACLTASSNTSGTPVPGCSGPIGAESGLQLTTADTFQEGGVSYNSSVPSSLGLDATFTTYQYAGTPTGADGIVFYLAASSPTDASSSPVTLGGNGGALGYAPRPDGADGLTHGYLGVGLDVYGNYVNADYSGSGCSDMGSLVPENVTVRGPGNGSAGYCIQSTQTVTQGALDSDSPVAVPVEVAVNPTGGDLTTASGVTVPAHDYVVVVTPTGDSSPIVETGALPSAAGFVPDSSWVDSNGVPLQLSFGWSAATGASTDYHTVSNANVTTLNGNPPALGVTLSDNSGGSAHVGQTVTYAATTSVSNADETRPITLTDTFPSQLTPLSAGLGGTGSGTTWSCGVSGQTVTCTHPAAPQGTLDPVNMPVTVAAAGANVADTVVVGSPDATQGSATDTQTYTPRPTATALAFTGQPVNTQVNTTMKNADNTTTHVQVSAEVGSGGAVDPYYTGAVTLAFSPGTAGNPQFVVNGSPTSSITVNAVNGVADFSPIIVNTVGFQYTLQATASGLTSATSNPFDVNSVQTACPSGQSCTTPPVTDSSGDTAVIQAQAGSGSTTITASFGGNVAPVHPCTGSASSVLTFSGDRQKLITETFPTNLPVLLFCYGQPTPFTDITLHKTTYYNSTNKEYEGLLPPCLLVPSGQPCFKVPTFPVFVPGTLRPVIDPTTKKLEETVVIYSGAADPKTMH